MTFGFISMLVMAYVLAYVVSYAAATTWLQGAIAGAWMWLGFVATISLGSVLWENRPWALYWINSLHSLVTLVIMGAILAVW